MHIIRPASLALGASLLLESTTAHQQQQQHPFGNAASSFHKVDGDDTPPSWRKDLLSFHRNLVEIPSRTGNESDVGEFLVEYLTSLDYTVHRQFGPPSYDPKNSARFNVLAWPPLSSPHATASSSPQPKVLVTTHIDVVPPYIPYSISDDKEPTSDTRIAGRGTVDAKGSLAAQVFAVQNLLAQDRISPHEVMFLFVVGEEDRGDGMRYFSQDRFGNEKEQKPHPVPDEFDAVIFGEPTENKLACGHKGGIFCSLHAKGVAGHSGYPWLGKSANELIVRALTRILDTDLGSSDLFGNTTVNVGKLDGGIALNVIPENSRADLAVRVAIGPESEGGETVRHRVLDILKDIDEDAFRLECPQIYGAIECTCNVDGFENVVVNYGTDVHNLHGTHKRYLYGPGSILVAHGDNEGLTVRELESSVEGFERLVLHALKK